MYDVANDEMRKSRRWATRERIEWLGGEILEDTGVEVDSSLVGSEVEGMTARGFSPRSQLHAGFQRQAY
jgi:hypothetical protein